MDGIQKHLAYFPRHLREALERFPRWESVCEIRLRDGLPLSLTAFDGNITIDEKGAPCALKDALRSESGELQHILGAFCAGSVYRYFDTLKDGFAVDEDGWRLGICPEKGSVGNFLPERPLGINLRIPRHCPDAADPLLDILSREGLSSFLILSKPGDGKTTLLRSLAASLSRGKKLSSPLRVAVVDERREIFPKRFTENTGLLDVLSGYEKKEGIEMATRLFAPQVILCDEIGSEEEVGAILSSLSGGCRVIATAHGESQTEAKKIFYLQKLLHSGLFQNTASIRRLPGKTYRSQILWEKIS